MKKPTIRIGTASKTLLLFNSVVTLIYFSWWFSFSNVDNTLLYALLFFGEIYHVIVALLFWFTLWPASAKEKIEKYKFKYNDFYPAVDIFIPVAGEPVDIVRKTALACRDLYYPNHKVFILNDGYVTKKNNYREIQSLAKELGVFCITRRIPGGAKAGNINHALKKTKGDIVVIFDADMFPYPDFLQRVVPYFRDRNVGFVQTPQYYTNQDKNDVTQAAWRQQELFFGSIMKGKEKSNASFICGTNVAIKREALKAVGGMAENNIAEDFITSLSIHQKGFTSYYIDEILAEGLAPEDLMSYFTQQLRWSRGSLEVLFRDNPFFKRSLTISQKCEYLASALYHFNGLIVLIDILMPLIVLYTGMQPVGAATTTFALYFLPFMFLSLYTLYIISDNDFTFKAFSFSYSSFVLQLIALKSLLLGQKMGFSVTPKVAQSGNFLFLVYPHIAYIVFFSIGFIVGVEREGFNPSIAANVAWGVFNTIMFIPFIRASYPWGNLSINGSFIWRVLYG